jgi:phenylpropionate dioxygenase-like ring-hydroxylating dioxygenase large terminal subunit
MTLVSDGEPFRVSRRIYVDEEVHRRELDRVFRRSWLFLAHESEVPEPGDYVTRRLGLDPVIVIRDEAGTVRVFLNTCRHRGVVLCRSDRGNSSHFRCSYHGWTYANDGRLRGVTFQHEVFGPDFRRSDYSLFEPAKVETMFGLVFATFDASAPSLVEYLGDMYWYLESVLGKFAEGLVVAGPPVRTLLKANWKLESENLSGDGYHTPVTHATAFSLGLFATRQDLEAVGEVTGKKFVGHTVDCGNGHTMRIQTLPVSVERNSYFGYPEDMWDAFDRRLSAGQAQVQSCLSVGHGTVFPNLSLLENFKTSVDGPGRHVRYIRLTLRYPLAPDRTEVLWFHLLPRGTDPEWAQLSRLGYLRTNGAAGMFEVDDTANFVGIAEANAGPTARGLHFELRGGTAHSPASTLDWPGHVVEGDRTERTIRAFLRRWSELVEPEAADADRAFG